MKTVLLVEDDPINARVFTKILTKRGGLEVQQTDDVEEILQLVQSGTIGIILMDVSLCNTVYQGEPLDGLKISKMLKADPKTAYIPILLASVNVTSSQCESFLKLSDADGCISKPVVDQQEFLEPIMNLMLKD